MAIHTPLPTLHREIEAYLCFMDEARREVDVAELATYEAAEARADAILNSSAETPGPGKFSANDDGPLAEILYFLSLDHSFLDEQIGSVDEHGWFGRIGRFVVETDDQGFFYYMDHVLEAKAEAAFARIEADYPMPIEENL